MLYEVITINLSTKYPEVVESMKKELAGIIKNGRSTPGAAQKNDPFDEKEGCVITSYSIHYTKLYDGAPVHKPVSWFWLRKRLSADCSQLSTADLWS